MHERGDLTAARTRNRLSKPCDDGDHFAEARLLTSWRARSDTEPLVPSCFVSKAAHTLGTSGKCGLRRSHFVELFRLSHLQ